MHIYIYIHIHVHIYIHIRIIYTCTHIHIIYTYTYTYRLCIITCAWFIMIYADLILLMSCHTADPHGFFIDAYAILLSDVPSQNNTPPARSVCNFFPSTQACCVGPHIWLLAPQTLRVFGLVTAPQKELEDPPCLGRRIVQKFQGILRITSPDAQWHRGSVVQPLGPRLSNCGRGRVAALRMLWWSARINFGRTPCRCPVLAGWDGHENLLDHQNPHNGIKWVTFWYQTLLNMINDPTGWQET